MRKLLAVLLYKENTACLFVRFTLVLNSVNKKYVIILSFIERDGRLVQEGLLLLREVTSYSKWGNHLKPSRNRGYRVRDETGGVIRPCLCREGAAFLS